MRARSRSLFPLYEIFAVGLTGLLANFDTSIRVDAVANAPPPPPFARLRNGGLGLGLGLADVVVNFQLHVHAHASLHQRVWHEWPKRIKRNVM